MLPDSKGLNPALPVGLTLALQLFSPVAQVEERSTDCISVPNITSSATGRIAEAGVYSHCGVGVGPLGRPSSGTFPLINSASIGGGSLIFFKV